MKERTGDHPRELTFVLQETSGAPRANQHVGFGLPVPKGLLDNRNQIAVSDSDGRRLPVQTELLGTYPGGLPRWVFLQFSTSLGAQSEKSLKLEFGPTDEDGSALVVVEEGDRICVETGAVSFSLRRAGFSLPNDLTLGSTGPILHEPSLGFRAVKHTSGGTKEFFTGLDRNTELTVVEKGPVRAVVHYSGKHGSRDGSAWLDYDVWVSATLDSPIVSLRYRVMNQEENPMDGGSSAGLEDPGEEFTTITEMNLDVRLLTGEGERKLMGGNDSRYETSVEVQDSARLNQLTRNKYRIEGSRGEELARFWALGWADICDSSFGLGVSLEDFAHNFPKGITLEPSRIIMDVHPASAEPLALARGESRTHTIHLRPHSPEDPMTALSGAVSTLEPPSVILPAEWYGRCGVLGDIFPPKPRKYPIFSILMRQVMLPARYGGAYHTLAFENNSDYDLNHDYFVQYARTGERNYLRTMMNGTLHTMQKDFRRCSPGHQDDGAFHVKPDDDSRYSLQIDHKRVQGLLDRYFFLGDKDAIEIAMQAGENALLKLRSGNCEDMPGPDGWPLLLMCVLYEATCEARFLAAATSVVELVHRKDKDDNFFRDGIDVTKAILLNGLACYADLADDDKTRKTFLEAVSWMTDHQVTEGVVQLKARPDYPLENSACFIFPLLKKAFELTREEEYLDVMEAMFSRYGRPGGSDRQEKGNYLRNIFGLMQALDETGRLNDLAYLAE